MIDPATLQPITGTFLAPLINDTGTNNWGRKEWEANFRLARSIGMDTIILIGVEYDIGGHRQSALDPRNTTWKEDPNLFSMVFRLCEENGLKLYCGGVCDGNNVYADRPEEEIAENRQVFEMALDRFGKHKCFHGFYVTLEAIPWQYHWPEIVEGVCDAARALDRSKKTLISPTFNAPRGDMASRYTPQEFGEVYGRMFDRLKGKLDACAWQDKFNDVDCKFGQMQPNVLDQWYAAAQVFHRRNGIALWGNVESFQRPSQAVGAHAYFRQADYRNLITKIQSASRFCEKLITFEFFTCMSPQAEWGSAGRLLERYIEAVGIDRARVAWPQRTAPAAARSTSFEEPSS